MNDFYAEGREGIAVETSGGQSAGPVKLFTSTELVANGPGTVNLQDLTI